MNNQTLQDICTSVYTNEEYADLRYKAGILRGEVHSKVESMTFHSYEAPPVSTL